jgi:hypothetical protein
MNSRKATQITLDDQLTLIRWLIERSDGLRESTANRAATVVSACALLIAGNTFFLDKVLSVNNELDQTSKFILIASISLSVLLLILSILFATTAFAFAWKTTRKAVKAQFSGYYPYFKARDTVEKFTEVESYLDEFKRTNKEQMIEYGLGELFLVQEAQHKRYQALRAALRYLLLSVAPLIVTIIVMAVSIS